MQYCDYFNELNTPENWKKPITNWLKRNFMKYELDINSADYQRISAQFDGIYIKKIEVIQNINLWEDFQTEIKFIQDKQKND